MPKPPEGVIFARKKDIPVEIRYFCGSVNFYKKKVWSYEKSVAFCRGAVAVCDYGRVGKGFPVCPD